jgi:hypothetical protein
MAAGYGRLGMTRPVEDPALSWESFVGGLAQPKGPLTPTCAKQIRDLWSALERGAERVRPPHAAVTPAGGLSMTWDKGRHHFEIDVMPDGKYDWFYMDRESEARASQEDIQVGFFSTEMFSYLRRTFEKG